LEEPQIVIGGEEVEIYPAVVLDTLPVSLPEGVEIVQEKVDGLEVVDIPLDSIPASERPKKHKHKKVHKKEVKVNESIKDSEESVEEQVEESAEESTEEFAKESVEEKKEKLIVDEKIAESKGKVKESFEVKEEILSPEEKISKEVSEKTKHAKPREFESKGLFPKGVPPEVESKIDEKIRLLLGEKPKDESDKVNEDSEQTDSEEK